MHKKILFGLTGSIACYKACDLISSLVKKNYEVQTVLTKNAAEFIGPATLEGLTGLPALTSSYESSRMMDHIHKVRQIDLFIICPATAKTLNQLSTGTGDGILFDLYLANNFKKPLFLFPAMNSEMLKHPATQDSMTRLTNWGAHIFFGQEGSLACGEYGEGRLMEPSQMLSLIEKQLNTSRELFL